MAFEGDECNSSAIVCSESVPNWIEIPVGIDVIHAVPFKAKLVRLMPDKIQGLALRPFRGVNF